MVPFCCESVLLCFACIAVSRPFRSYFKPDRITPNDSFKISRGSRKPEMPDAEPQVETFAEGDRVGCARIVPSIS